MIPLTELDRNAITEAAVGASQDLELVTEALALPSFPGPGLDRLDFERR